MVGDIARLRHEYRIIVHGRYYFVHWKRFSGLNFSVGAY